MTSFEIADQNGALLVLSTVNSMSLRHRCINYLYQE